MTKTEELLALADALKTDRSVSHRPFRYTCDKAAAALREFAGTMAPEPVGTVTHAGHVDWYDQPPPAVWTKLYLHPPAPTTQEPVAWIGPYKSAWDALNELRKSCAEIIGTDPKTWPNHGNAPLAIAVTLAIARTHMEQGTHPPAPTTQEPVADDARNVLRFFAGIDLATHDLPSNFAWHVLEARAVLAAQQEKK